MHLTDIWFLLIAVLWTGYLVLEGFDFGVGMLLQAVAKDPVDRQVTLRTIGPVWDGNEVWLLVAGGATFAAFPFWYASLFSGFYLALLVILVALIVRGIALEYRNKLHDPQKHAAWHRRWDLAIVISSAVPALLWGVALANIVRGVPLDAEHNFTGNFFTLLNPYALLGGLTTLALFALHGAIFIALKTHGPVRDRARALVLPLAGLAVPLAAAFLLWTQTYDGSWITWVLAVLAAGSLITGVAASRMGRDGLGFLGTAATIVFASATLFVTLYPNVLPSTTDPAFSLTTTNASSTHYTLTIMTWVAVVFTPIVLLYQSYTYWVFRRRLTRDDIPQRGTPARPAPAETA
ncbi:MULTISPECIES: cytochrome d ubiquinol oxidase subunit II [Kribbella]|uniref:Cytochrome d ubiquinol oxidase subunit II n=1 Tax=Kribbella karoonensis TaxID=324851 RepID=A0ABN2E878_9ACTN